MGRHNVKEIIKNHFLLNPYSKLRVRQIERTLKLPLPSVIRYCKELKKEGILATEHIGDVVFYTADRISESFIIEKKLGNLRSIYESGLVEYLRTELSNPVVVLFGSYAKGEDVEDSDIDFYIETHSKKILDLSKFEKRLSRRIQVFRHKHLSEIKNKHLTNNILNGVILNGFMEVLK